MCRHHGFLNRAAIILCKRASYGLKHGKLEDAINDADNCITTDPDFLEVSLIRLGGIDGGSTYMHVCMC